MSWIDSIPTIGEVFDFCICRLYGHDWEKVDCSLPGQPANPIRICRTCHKSEAIRGEE